VEFDDQESVSDFIKVIRMKVTLAVSALLMWLAGCAGLYRTAGDRAFCEFEPTDQVERQANREICR
jgi:hypothetical protein